KLTNNFVELMDGEVIQVMRDQMIIQDLEGNDIERDSYIAEIDASDTELGTYPHYMIKEINEQPQVMSKIIKEYQDDNGHLKIDDAIIKQLNDADRLYIIAAGTSYHAGLIGKEYIEKWAGVPTDVHVASEFVYNTPLLSGKPLFIFISQSGETAYSRAVRVDLKERGYPALTITIVAAVTARDIGKKSDLNLMSELGKVTTAITSVIDDASTIEEIVKNFLETTRNAFFIGRTMDYYVGLEGALKLKEISYIQAEGF